MSEIVEVNLTDITYDTATQMRAGIDAEVVADYAESIDRLPPVDLITDSVTHWIADGWHRVAAHRRAGRETVKAHVTVGSLDDAIDLALGANPNHGLRLTRADKRKKVRIALARHPEWSNGRLADLTHVTEKMVRDHRSLMDLDGGPRIGKDGKEYKHREKENAGDGDEHYTPDVFLTPTHELLGRIDLDPASCEKANARVRAKRIYTIEDDGLSREWENGKTLFCNPPYSAAKNFADKFVETMEKPGGFEHGLLLVNNPTEAIWFQRALRACTGICFVLGRRSFVDGVTMKEEGVGRKGSVFFYFGDRLQKFERLFAPLGIVGFPTLDGNLAYSVRRKHNGWCALCGEAASTGKYCPTCKQTDGRRDRQWRNPVRAAVAMAKAKGNHKPNPTALAVKIPGTPSWKQVAALLIADNLVDNDYRKELGERLRAASGVNNIEDWD